MNWLLNAQWHVLGADILWREIIGNLFGVSSAILGMRRKVWAWPIGMIGNALLFTVFLGGVFATPQDKDLYGQAGRQVFFFLAAVYGWYRWKQNRGAANNAPAVAPRWATGKERLIFLAAAAALVAIGYVILSRIGSYGPLADSWIFVGSLLATIGMAKGLHEFWLVWIAVDIVGVPLLLQAGYYPSALLYLAYGFFCLWGFVTWVRINRTEARPTDPIIEAVA